MKGHDTFGDNVWRVFEITIVILELAQFYDAGGREEIESLQIILQNDS